MASRRVKSEAAKEARRTWKKRHPESVRKYRNSESAKLHHKRHLIKTRYGISLPEYEARLTAQENICALCKEPFGKDGSERPVLDHCHEGKTLRSFIHDRCNVGLGRFNDNAVKCRLAAEYLEKHRPVGPAQPTKGI